MTRSSAPNPFRSKFGARVKALREERGLGLAEAAVLLGTSSSYLSTVERGNCEITVETIDRFAEGLGVRPMHLLIDPEADEIQAIVELVRKLPAHALPELRNELKAQF